MLFFFLRTPIQTLFLSTDAEAKAAKERDGKAKAEAGLNRATVSLVKPREPCAKKEEELPVLKKKPSRTAGRGLEDVE